jgi:hypothetical protein
MKTHFAPVALLAAIAAMFMSFATSAAPVERIGPATPQFVIIPNDAPGHTAPRVNRAQQLTQWSGSFKDRNGARVRFVMVGTDPNTTNQSTTVPLVVIPIKMVYGATNGNRTFSVKNDTLPNGHTVLDQILSSPIFKSIINFKSGGQSMGTTQYIDAYQRGNFFSAVQNHNDYHVLLGKATVLPTLTINVSSSQGFVATNPFGTIPVGVMDISAFDAQLQSYMSSHAGDIKPNVLPLFLTDNIYLTANGCCIGGYHSANGPNPAGQTYSYATYVTEVGSFAQDVSALSHEIGEWMDDPFVNNAVNCSDPVLFGVLENGDPLEGFPNFGGIPYRAGGFTYNLQDLVYLPFFGAPRSTSVDRLLSFNKLEKNLCQGQ